MSCGRVEFCVVSGTMGSGLNTQRGTDLFASSAVKLAFFYFTVSFFIYLLPSFLLTLTLTKRKRKLNVTVTVSQCSLTD